MDKTAIISGTQTHLEPEPQTVKRGPRDPYKSSSGPSHPTEETQAERIFKKFGGAGRLAEILKAIGLERDRSALYKWTYSKEKGGTGGLIPTSAWPELLEAARIGGVFLSVEDRDPAPTRLKPPRSGPRADQYLLEQCQLEQAALEAARADKALQLSEAEALNIQTPPGGQE